MIEKRYYTASTLKTAVAVYEREYDMTSVEFFEAHTTDATTLRGIPGFQRSVWAGLLQELRQFDGPDCATSAFAADEDHSFRLAV
jgi:hypothetical protein